MAHNDTMLWCLLILMTAWTLPTATASVAPSTTSPTKANLPVAGHTIPRVKMKTQQELNLAIAKSRGDEARDEVTTVLRDNNSLESFSQIDAYSSDDVSKSSNQKIMMQKLIMAAQKSSQTDESKYIRMALAANGGLVASNRNYDSINDEVTSGNGETSKALQKHQDKNNTKSTYQHTYQASHKHANEIHAGKKHLFVQGHYKRAPHYTDKNLAVIKHNQMNKSRYPYQNTIDRKLSNVSHNEIVHHEQDVENLSAQIGTMSRHTANVDSTMVTLDRQVDVLDRQIDTVQVRTGKMDTSIISIHAKKPKEKSYIVPVPADCPDDCQCKVLGQSLTLQCTQPPIDTQLRVYFTALSESLSISNLTFTHSGLDRVPDAIRALSSLEGLDLSYNNVDKLFNHTFKGLSRLQSINLEKNKISYIEVGTFMQPELIKLRIVKLEYNNLTVIDSWPFKMPSFLHYQEVSVNVSYNNIYKMENTLEARAREISPFQTLVLDLSYNNISHIGDFNVVALLHVTRLRDAIGAWNCGFLFHNNPLACDCDMYWFMKILRPAIPLFRVFQDLSLIQIPCSSPPETRGTLIYELPEYMFRCDVKDDCPDGAVCVHTPGNSTITVVNHNISVNALPYVVPSEKHIQLYFENSNIKRIEPMDYLENVTQLVMQNSKIEVIEKEAVRKLRGIEVLNLKNNAIHRLPYSFMRASSVPNLSTIDITENPFICDCLSVDFKKWLIQRRSIISDIQNVRCNSFPFYNTPVINVPDNLFICGFGTLVIFSVTSLAIILIALLCYILSEYKRRIRLRLLKLFNHNFRLGKTDEERAIRHDFIIVVCDEDEDNETVNQFTTTMKSAFPAFTIHTYATLFGQSRFQNLPDIEQSRTLIYLLSKNYLGDNYYVYLFRLGLDLFLRHYGSICLVPVLLDSHDALLSTDPIDGDVRTFLSHFRSVDVRADELPLRVEFIMHKQIASLELLKPCPRAFNSERSAPHGDGSHHHHSSSPLIDASELPSHDQMVYHEHSNLQETSGYADC